MSGETSWRVFAGATAVLVLAVVGVLVAISDSGNISSQPSSMSDPSISMTRVLLSTSVTINRMTLSS